MRIEKKNILDDYGNPFQMFGINVNGFEIAGHGYCVGGLWANITMQDIAANIRKAGYNMVRLPVHPKMFEDKVIGDDILGVWEGSKNEKLKGLKSMGAFLMFLEALEDQGIYYVIDHHYLEKGFESDIPPLWYTSNYSESRWLSDLGTIAGLLKGMPGFIGIDIKNEPGKGVTWGTGDVYTDWKIASEKAFRAIDAINPECLIIVEAFSTTSLYTMHINPPAIPSDRLLMSYHLYGPEQWPWLSGLNDPNFPKNQRATWDSMFGNVARERVVYIGEFGGTYQANTKDKLYRDELMSYLKDNGIIHLSEWAYGPNGGSYQITDGTYIKLREDKIESMNRVRTPYATYIDSELPKPTDPEKPKPEQPTVNFLKGEIIKHKSGTGPDILYLGDGNGEFWNDRQELCRVKVDNERFQ